VQSKSIQDFQQIPSTAEFSTDKKNKENFDEFDMQQPPTVKKITGQNENNGLQQNLFI
jgi:hypothetical protein